MAVRALVFFCSLSHILFGLLSLFVPFYMNEFIRYGMSDFRMPVGCLQILCGMGLLVFTSSRLRLMMSGVLAILMGGAIVVRVYIQDDLIQTLPAILYFVLNVFIFIKPIKS